jgi:hypothetical protein
MIVPMRETKKKTIRIYFRDNHHTHSYLSFVSEEAAAKHLCRIRERFRSLTVVDEESQLEQFDSATSVRVIEAAAKLRS